MFVSLLALAVGVAGASWYFADRGEPDEPEQVSRAVGFASGEAERNPEERQPAKVTTTSGLQTTVPGTLGLDAATAAFTLEEGGFRVRVMSRIVSDSRDEGIVVQQLPREGVTRRVGWIVTIVVGRLR